MLKWETHEVVDLPWADPQDHFDKSTLGKNVEHDLVYLFQFINIVAERFNAWREASDKHAAMITYYEGTEKAGAYLHGFFNHFTVLSEKDALHWVDTALREVERIRAPGYDGPIGEAEWELAPLLQKLADHCNFRALQEDGDPEVWRNRYAMAKASLKSLPKPPRMAG
jgi:hypothetical protein